MKTSLAHAFDYQPVRLVRGKGSYVWDDKGKRFLDFIGGWCVATVGWKDQRMEKAIVRQARKGFYIPALFSDPNQEAFARDLCRLAPGKMVRAIRATSGSEAVEFAIKCARAATGKPTIVSIDGTWHGHTYGAASLGNACSKRMAPCLPGFIKLPLPTTEKKAAEVVKAFERLCKTRKDIAAFMSEPIWTNAGCFVPPSDFYPKIEAICRKYGVLLVMDEVATCMGRTGKMFGSDWWGIKPDVMCLGKSLTGGYATLAATLVTGAVWKKAEGIPVYATFGWLAQDLAAVRENVRLILTDRLVENARRVGSILLNELKPLEEHSHVKEVRGQGMVFGIEFKKPVVDEMMRRLRQRGVLVASASDKILFFSPPLSLSEREAKIGARIIREACSES